MIMLEPHNVSRLLASDTVIGDYLYFLLVT